MNKKELIEVIAENACSKKEATDLVNAVFDTIVAQLKKGNTVEIAGFGKFEVSKRAARSGVNPATGEKIKIAATKVPKFKAAKALKESVK